MSIIPLELYNTDDVKNSQYKHAPKPSGFKTWREYWEFYSEKTWPEKCRLHGCGNCTKGSAHVVVNGDEAVEYIIPMCDHHLGPSFTEFFSVNNGTVAVPIESFNSIDELPLAAGKQVKNVPDTGSCSPPEEFRSWKQFYEKYRRRRTWPSTCRIQDCNESPVGGGHVYVEGTKRVYILPMCGTHNTPHVTDWFPVKENSIAVRDVTRSDLEMVKKPPPRPAQARPRPAPAFAPTPVHAITALPTPVHVPVAAPGYHSVDIYESQIRRPPVSSSHRVTINDSKPTSKKKNRCTCIIV